MKEQKRRCETGWSFEKEQKELFEKMLSSDEELTIVEFIDKYASPQYLEECRKEEERVDALHAKGIWE